MLAQAPHVDVAYIDAVDPHAAASHIVETGNQVNDGGLARAGRTDDGNRLPGLRGKGNILQHRHTVFI